MQDRQNYNYYENNSQKDMNQYGQGNQKGGKKQGYKYHKGRQNKNYINNNDEIGNNNEYNQGFQPYRGRGNRQNYMNNNSGNNQKFKNRKKINNRDNNNNDFIYPGNNNNINNNIEVNQTRKEEYLEQQQNNNNINGNNFGKQYKSQDIHNNKNNNIINNNINNLNNTIGSINMSNTNTSSGSSISKVNLTPQGKNKMMTSNGYNLTDSNSPQSQGQNIPNQSSHQLYINPKYMSGNALDDNLSEGGRSSNNKSEDLNKNQNYINPDIFINNGKFFQNNNQIYNTTYNMGNQLNPNLDNINNFNNIQLQHYNQTVVNQYNNLNFQRQIYDNKNNKIYNHPQMPPNCYQKNEDMNKKMKDISQNKIYNNPLPFNNFINPNYSKIIKNQGHNDMQMNLGNNIGTNLSQSSQGPKNTIPNFFPGDLTFTASQNQMMPPLIHKNYNRNFYIGPKNQHMMNNFPNNTNILQNDKDFYPNNGIMYNNIGQNNNNNKKYLKQYNNYMYQGNIHSNSNNQISKNNNNMIINDNNNFFKSNSNKETIKFKNWNQPTKQYFMELNLNLGGNKIESIKIKNFEDFKIKLRELKQKIQINDAIKKVITDKVGMAFELTSKVFGAEIDKFSYKYLTEFSKNKNFLKGRKYDKKMKRNKSFTKSGGGLINLTKNEIEKFESLNISI